MGEKKGNLATALVLFIVVFLPLGSLFYLQKGFHYHKGVWEDMKTSGNVPTFQFTNSTQEKPVTNSVLKGQISMLGFYNDSNEADFLQMFGKFYDQFKQDETVFIGVDLDGNFDSKGILDKYELPYSKDFILANGEVEAKSLINNLKVPDFTQSKDEDGHFHLKPPSTSDMTNYPIIILVDEYGELRNYIQWNTKKGFNKAVEQMAILITHHELGDKKVDEK